MLLLPDAELYFGATSKTTATLKKVHYRLPKICLLMKKMLTYQPTYFTSGPHCTFVIVAGGLEVDPKLRFRIGKQEHL